MRIKFCSQPGSAALGTPLSGVGAREEGQSFFKNFNKGGLKFKNHKEVSHERNEYC
ncbi:MAG: hypothetical protein BWY23_00668 [Spirochaetes bacterium ADurb.Bin218]|jgi:hypothetical protein|nr:MAG: hypothetical protein BWY23_00668 [Spirochaetes bacterium ADurb.Bin218]